MFTHTSEPAYTGSRVTYAHMVIRTSIRTCLTCRVSQHTLTCTSEPVFTRTSEPVRLQCMMTCKRMSEPVYAQNAVKQGRCVGAKGTSGCGRASKAIEARQNPCPPTMHVRKRRARHRGGRSTLRVDSRVWRARLMGGRSTLTQG